MSCIEKYVFTRSRPGYANVFLPSCWGYFFRARNPTNFLRHHLSCISVCEWRYLCIAASVPHRNKISGFFSCRQRQRREWIGSFIQPKLSVQRIPILVTRKKRNQNLKLKNSSLVAKMLHYRTLFRIKSSD